MSYTSTWFRCVESRDRWGYGMLRDFGCWGSCVGSLWSTTLPGFAPGEPRQDHVQCLGSRYVRKHSIDAREAGAQI
eukprot:4380405-Amphidinium_carterae.1